jgi:NTP pyrophosphatase (non-canonical NTP hydrolase)
MMQPGPVQIMTPVDIIVALSRWVDEHEANAGRDPEALSWHRVAKVSEEAGEVIDAMIQYTGGNPRKQEKVGDPNPVIEELLDTAIAALGAVEHMTGNHGASMALLNNKLRRVGQRAGVLQ